MLWHRPFNNTNAQRKNLSYTREKSIFIRENSFLIKENVFYIVLKKERKRNQTLLKNKRNRAKSTCDCKIQRQCLDFLKKKKGSLSFATPNSLPH